MAEKLPFDRNFFSQRGDELKKEKNIILNIFFVSFKIKLNYNFI